MNLKAHFLKRLGQLLKPFLARRGSRAQERNGVRPDAGADNVFEDWCYEFRYTRQSFINDDRDMIIGGQGLAKCWVFVRDFQPLADCGGDVIQGRQGNLTLHRYNVVRIDV